MGGPDDFNVADHWSTTPTRRRPSAALLVLVLAVAVWVGLLAVGWLVWTLLG